MTKFRGSLVTFWPSSFASLGKFCQWVVFGLCHEKKTVALFTFLVGKKETPPLTCFELISFQHSGQQHGSALYCAYMVYLQSKVFDGSKGTECVTLFSCC